MKERWRDTRTLAQFLVGAPEERVRMTEAETRGTTSLLSEDIPYRLSDRILASGCPWHEGVDEVVNRPAGLRRPLYIYPTIRRFECNSCGVTGSAELVKFQPPPELEKHAPPTLKIAGHYRLTAD